MHFAEAVYLAFSTGTYQTTNDVKENQKKNVKRDNLIYHIDQTKT
jgi:hypothetical protein